MTQHRPKSCEAQQNEYVGRTQLYTKRVFVFSLQICMVSSIYEAQTTCRHKGLQCVCFSEVHRHKNVYARSSPHRYGPSSSKVYELLLT